MSSTRKPRTRHLSVFVLVVLAALGLTAIIASGAEAAEWTIEGKTLKELKISEEKISITGGPITMQGTSWDAFRVKCPNAEGSGVIGYSGFSKEFRFELSGCYVYGEKEVCEVSGESMSFRGTATLSADGKHVVLSPESSEFTVFGIYSGYEPCLLVDPLPEREWVLSGTSGGQVEAAGGAVGLTFSKESANATGTLLRHSTAEWFMEGGFQVKLSGANAGKTLGVK